MYEGQTIICKDVIEDNWLEYLAAVKKQYGEEEERNKKRMEKLAEIDDGAVNTPLGALNSAKMAEPGLNRRYYDISINSFWNWYIENKVEMK
jgi:hypothetical protein